VLVEENHLKQYLHSSRAARTAGLKMVLRRSEIPHYGFWPSCGKEFSLGLWQPLQVHEDKYHCRPGLLHAWVSNLALLRPTSTFHEDFPEGAFLPVHHHPWPQRLPLSSRACGTSSRLERSSLGCMCQDGFLFPTGLLASFSFNMVSLRTNGEGGTCDIFFTFRIHHSHRGLFSSLFRESSITSLYSMVLSAWCETVHGA